MIFTAIRSEDPFSISTSSLCRPYSHLRCIVIMHSMIDWADRLRSHPGYITAALKSAEVNTPTVPSSLPFLTSGAQIYVKLHDNPALAKETQTSGIISPVISVNLQLKY